VIELLAQVEMRKNKGKNRQSSGGKSNEENVNRNVLLTNSDKTIDKDS
jgi:hypothetical protein